MEQSLLISEVFDWLRNVLNLENIQPQSLWREGSPCTKPEIGRLLHDYHISIIIMFLRSSEEQFKEWQMYGYECPLNELDRLNAANELLNHHAGCKTCFTAQAPIQAAMGEMGELMSAIVVDYLGLVG